MATSVASTESPSIALSRRTARQATVCQVLHSLTVGGAEVLAARLARGLGDRYRFVFACLDDIGPLGDKLRDEGFVVELIGRRPGFDIRCVRRLAAFMRQQHVDLIHAHQYTPFFYCRAPGVLRSRPPVLFNEHGRFHPDYPSRKRMVFNRLALRRKDRVVSVGESVRRALIANEGIPARRIDVIYNGVDLARYSQTPTERAEVRRELGLNEEEFVVMQVARLDVIKDHPTAIRAMEHVCGEHPDARLLIVGDGPERARIEREVNRRRLDSEIRLLGERSDVARLLAAADCFLLTSVSEGIPVTLIEAMGAALPVVATDVGGVGEVVKHGLTGILAPSGSDLEISAGLKALVQQPTKAAAFGQAGRSRALELFTERAMHDAYDSAYREMLGQSRPRGIKPRKELSNAHETTVP